ncbi:hypothetical protein AX16_000406 [Volvariella volvacea WC 439]|nr:hypothetical protein AX16_000406 [Volvariella volvacea WC 439]
MDREQQALLIRRIVNPIDTQPEDLSGLSALARPPTQDEVHHEIEQKLLLPKNRLPSHWLPSYQVHWKHKLSVPSLLSLDPSPAPTTVSFVRGGLDGHVIGYAETPAVRPATAAQSTSLDRAPGPAKSFVRGKSGHIPFLPGGLEDVLEGPLDGKTNDIDAKRLRSIPPGFTRGLRLPGDQPNEDEDWLGLEGVQENGEAAQHGTDDLDQSIDDHPSDVQTGNEIDEFLPTTTAHLKPAQPRKSQRVNIQKRDWAHVIDVNTPLTNFHELYPFELDTFQKQAVYHLEMGDSVFVAAHTSAGKTVVAEYAIALAEKHMTRAIYTSPIKALSNQKFRDFKQTFSANSVGILTGDVQINPEASCLVMTTEILRSMLYKGADLIRDVEFVIFDEVHYVNDAERGVVWEEVIIMLPDHVNIILLSATVPNTKEFADWVGRTKKKDIYVISTAQRPVPLEHYLYAGRDVFMIVDAKRNFLGQGYKEAGEALKRKQDKEREAAGLPPIHRVGARGAAANQRGQQRGAVARGAPRGRGAGTGGGLSRTIHTGMDKNLYVHLLNLLKKQSWLPVVVFTLSKKRCEENASTLTNMDLCTSVEKSEVHVTIEKALARLKGSDKKLPQIARMRDLLSRGIGVHHGGLLPLVKEVVEILFARGLVKILFATETFAMGVNMPAKCVVFSGIRKHDGRNFREILPGEYTQMAGRAGRRGLDTTGTVIIVCNDNLPEQGTLQTMMLGTPGKLQSQFRLTYSMILNLLRVEALKVEEMIKRSFSENASQRLLPENQKKVIQVEKQLGALPKLECEQCSPSIDLFYEFSSEIVNANAKLLRMASEHPQGAKILSPGRVVILRDGHFERNNVAVILKQAPALATESGVFEKVKMYYILAWVSPETKGNKKDGDWQSVPPLWPPNPDSLVVDNGTYELRAVSLTSVSLVSDKTIKVEIDEILDRKRISKMQGAVSALAELVHQWVSNQSVAEIDWTRMRQLQFQDVLRNRDAFVKQLDRKAIACTSFEQHYGMVHREQTLKANIAQLKRAISDQNLDLIPDYEQRIEVLKELRFIDENSTVLLKGRVACEINSANELVLTELILENTLANYEPEEVVALLSCFVFQEKTELEPLIPPKLEEGRDAILAINDRVGHVQDAHKVAAEEFRSKLHFGLIEVVYEWARGMPFEQITALTDVAEGTIVRVITRLDETCREVRDAARVIGDAELFKKMEECQTKIKRDSTAADTRTAYTKLEYSNTDSDSNDPPSVLPKKRPRASSAEVLLAGDHDEGPTKTRRVNPQRLASRLDPNLVEEMEAHIVPGAKMPPFDIRKDLQERYNVDRRHIYDYFHSRGLRVAKEDKHINLLRVRSQRANMAAAQAAAAAQASTGQAQPKTETGDKPISPSANVIATNAMLMGDSAPESPDNAKMRTAEHTPILPPPAPAKARKKIVKGRKLRVQDATPSAPSTPPLLMDDHTSSDQCPEFTFSEENHSTITIEDERTTANDEVDFLCSFAKDSDDIYESQLDSLTLQYPDESYEESIDEHRPLSQEERMKFYELVDKNLGLVQTQMAQTSQEPYARFQRTKKTADTTKSSEVVTLCPWMLSLDGESAASQLNSDLDMRNPFEYTYFYDENDPLSPHNMLQDSLNDISSPVIRDQQESLPISQEQNFGVNATELSTGATCQPGSMESPPSPRMASVISNPASPLGESTIHPRAGQAMRPARLKTFSAGGGI